MSTESASTNRGRGAIALMCDPAFGALFWGKLLGIVGIWAQSIVAAIVIYDATGSATMVGLLAVMQFGPQVVLSPTSGKWADSGDPARQIFFGRILCVIGAGATAAWLGLASSHDEVAVLLGTLVVGIGFAVSSAPIQSIVPSLIRSGELPTAMALSSAPMPIGLMVGPAVGALIAANLGAAPAFSVSTGLHSVLPVLLLAVRFPAPTERGPSTDYRVRTGLRYVWHDRPLLLALLAVAAIGFASDPSVTLTPALAEELGRGVSSVGLLSAAFGVGATIALLLLAWQQGRLSSARTSSIGLWLLAVGSVLLAIATNFPSAMAGFAAAGFGFGYAMAGLTTFVQERAPDEYRGRIMSLWLVAFFGSRPIAAAVLGGTADLLSVRAAFVQCAALTTAVALVFRHRLLKPQRTRGAGCDTTTR